MMSRPLRRPADRQRGVKLVLCPFPYPNWGDTAMPGKRKPSYAFHRATAQGCVRINGNDHDLGEYDFPATYDCDNELVGAWPRKEPVDRIGLRVDVRPLMCMRWPT